MDVIPPLSSRVQAKRRALELTITLLSSGPLLAQEQSSPSVAPAWSSGFHYAAAGLCFVILAVILTGIWRRHRRKVTPPAPPTNLEQHDSMPAWWSLLDAAFEGALLCDQGRVIYANATAVAVIGHDRVDIIGKPLSLLFNSAEDSTALLERAALNPVVMSLSTGGAIASVELASRQQTVDHRCLVYVALRSTVPGSAQSGDAPGPYAILGTTSPAANQSSHNEHALALEHAQRSGHLHLQLQPVLSLESQQQQGARLNLHWPGLPLDHQDVDELQLYAQHSGLQLALSESLLHCACEHSMEPHNIRQQDPLYVKLAAEHFWQDNFVEALQTRVSEAGCAPAAILLLIDEGAVTQRLPAVIGRFQQLHAMGFLLGLDDFGQTQSSLRLLHSGALQHLLISTAWIKSMGTRKQDLRYLRDLVSYCHKLGLGVHLKQLTNDSHLQAARLIECDSISGPLVDKILTATT